MLSNMASVERDAEFNGTIAGIKIRTTKVLQQSPTMVTEIIIEFDMPKNNFSDEQKRNWNQQQTIPRSEEVYPLI